MTPLTSESRDIDLVPISHIVRPTIRECSLLGVNRESVMIVTTGFGGPKVHDSFSLRIEKYSN